MGRTKTMKGREDWETRKAPMPGDLIRVVASDDSLIKVGSYGVVNGSVNQPKSVCEVTFNYYTPYHDGKVVSASGGPVRRINASTLKYVGKKSLTVWKFEGLPTAGGGVNRKITVNVFEVDLNRSWS